MLRFYIQNPDTLRYANSIEFLKLAEGAGHFYKQKTMHFALNFYMQKRIHFPLRFYIQKSRHFASHFYAHKNALCVKFLYLKPVV